MIKLKVQFRDGDSLFEEQTVGFWSWRQFADYLRRLHRWRLNFRVISLEGVDSHSGRSRMNDGLEACTLDKCGDHWSSTNLFHWSMSTNGRQTDEEFIRILNERIGEYDESD